jgi:ubiquinone/menaquinone biosynthesis C-methylase UbiE
MKRKKPGVKTLLKLDLGCGENKQSGFTGVDFYSKADIKADLFKFPWPFEDNSVEEAHCSHFFEHVPAKVRIQFMDELYRVLIVGGKATFITPYWSSVRATQDPTHEWPPISENSYLYFNKGWREVNKLTHYLGTADFDFTYGYGLDPETAGKNSELQSFYVKHYANSVLDLHVTLVKRA